MKIAIEGCCHGQLDDIYGSIRLVELRENIKVDLVLICGDFQALRNEADMECMAVPDKYREIGTFWKYYTGKVKAPYPTIFIGGNHEACNYLWELYHGGWVCDNIYYLGHAGLINFGGLRIGGLSGISKGSYKNGHFEASPYNNSTIRSAYYVREYDVQKLLQISKPVDIFLSHDWPRGVERYGDLRSLMQKKSFFVDEIHRNQLGSHPNELILTKLQPSYWFAAHLHVHFAALVNHDMWKKGIYPTESQRILGLNQNAQPPSQYYMSINDQFKKNPDSIDIDLDDVLEDGVTKNPDEIGIGLDEDIQKPTEDSNNNDTTTYEGPNSTEKTTDLPKPENITEDSPKFTKFLSLDKCLPRRQFLQIVDIPSANDESGDFDFYYDLEWLAITRAMQPYLSTEYAQQTLPSETDLKAMIEKEAAHLEKKRQSGILDLKIPHNFEPTAPGYDPENPLHRDQIQNLKNPFLNPQTLAFCQEIEIINKVNPNCRKSASETSIVPERSNLNYDAPEFRPTMPIPHPEEHNNNKRLKVEVESEIVIDDDEFL